MKFVGIVGSNAEQSYNRMLLEFIRKNFKTKFELEVLEIDDIPMFNQVQNWEESFQLRLLNNNFVFLIIRSHELMALLLPLLNIIILLRPLLKVCLSGSHLLCIHSKINLL